MWAELQNMMDFDGDGIITPEEFVDGFTLMAMKTSTPQGTQPAVVGQQIMAVVSNLNTAVAGLLGQVEAQMRASGSPGW